MTNMGFYKHLIYKIIFGKKKADIILFAYMLCVYILCILFFFVLIYLNIKLGY